MPLVQLAHLQFTYASSVYYHWWIWVCHLICQVWKITFTKWVTCTAAVSALYVIYVVENDVIILILFQESLQEFGIVFWCHVTMVFTSDDIYWSLVAAHEHGLVAWSRTDMPTSAYTYYSVFHALDTERDKFQFQHMVDPEMAIYVNTLSLYNHLMKPWVYCVLNPQCSIPYGAQTTGCTIRRPSYLYTGCHMYDTSVFNVVLGNMFQGETPYRGKDAIFNITYTDHSTFPSLLFKGLSFWQIKSKMCTDSNSMPMEEMQKNKCTLYSKMLS